MYGCHGPSVQVGTPAPSAMVADWLLEAASNYNRESFELRDAYAAYICMKVSALEFMISTSVDAIPDECLFGFDPNYDEPNPEAIENAFGEGSNDLFSGQGYVLSMPVLANRGTEFMVMEFDEDWGVFPETRGARGSRYESFCHSHPQAPSLPSEGDIDASQNVEMILGFRFSPENPQLPFFDEFEHSGIRRYLTPPTDQSGGLPVVIRTHSWEVNHFELVAYHRTGVGINILLVEDGVPVGLDLAS